MSQIIASFIPQINEKISSSSDVSIVPTRKELKLCSADIAYLKILHFHKTKGIGYTYLTKEGWPVELVKFGGKSIHYRKQKERWAKMRNMGYVITTYANGNRNKEYNHYLTSLGSLALEAWISKNGPSKVKKRPLESKKTAPPLNHAETKDKHADALLRSLEEKDPQAPLILKSLIEIGFYRKSALLLMKKYTNDQLYTAYELTKKRKPYDPGAYMRSLLPVLFK